MTTSTRAQAVAIAFLAAGCASTTQTLQITPEILARGGVVGKGATVAVAVEDQRGAPPPRSPAEPEIVIEPGVDAAVHRAVVQGLEQLGFATTAGEAPRSLRVEIQEASLSTETGSGTMLLRSRAAIRVVAASGRRIQEKTYRSQRERRTVLLPNSTQNEEQLNFALNHALQQLFDDRELLSALAR